MKNYSASQKKQSGVILVVALIMLLIMTMVGVKTISDSTVQERMANNQQQLSLARVNAFSALNAAEQIIEGLSFQKPEDVKAAFMASDDNGLYIPLAWFAEKEDKPAAGKDMTDPSNWKDDDYSNTVDIGSGFTDSRYFVEYIGQLISNGGATGASLDAEDKDKVDTSPLVFRITAIGYGANEKNTAILQSIYSTAQGSL